MIRPPGNQLQGTLKRENGIRSGDVADWVTVRFLSSISATLAAHPTSAGATTLIACVLLASVCRITLRDIRQAFFFNRLSNQHCRIKPTLMRERESDEMGEG